MTALEQMLEEELKKEKKHSSTLLSQLKTSQMEFTKELQRVSMVFEQNSNKMKVEYEKTLIELTMKLEELMRKSENTQESGESEIQQLKQLKNSVSILQQKMKSFEEILEEI